MILSAAIMQTLLFVPRAKLAARTVFAFFMELRCPGKTSVVHKPASVTVWEPRDHNIFHCPAITRSCNRARIYLLTVRVFHETARNRADTIKNRLHSELRLSLPVVPLAIAHPSSLAGEYGVG